MPNKSSFLKNNYYHIVNSGVEKRLIFLDKKDIDRFVSLIDYYRFKNPAVRFSFRKRPSNTHIETPTEEAVKIICFCLMPNHFHLLLRQEEETPISNFLSKISNSYTKYFNNRYKRVGPLFKGTFNSVPVEKIEDVVNISRHIHLDPSLGNIVKDSRRFPFSSYPEYLALKEGFCQKKYILDSFPTAAAYERFVQDIEDYQETKKDIDKLLLEKSL